MGRLLYNDTFVEWFGQMAILNDICDMGNGLVSSHLTIPAYYTNSFLQSLSAGSCWSTSAHCVAASAKSSSEAARRQSEHALISANFLFPLWKPQKK